MKALGRLAPVIGGLLVLLTYLLVRGATPDADLHERALGALRALILNDAALHRDMLRARAELLHNYDPLVRSAGDLRDAVATLGRLREALERETALEMTPRLEQLTTAVGEQEQLVEAFKSNNALLHNSLSFFNHGSYEFGRRAAGPDEARALGLLASEMLRFSGNPTPDTAAAVVAALDRLVRLPMSPDMEADARTLAAHGRLIVALLPQVDGIVRRLLAAPIGPQARLLQDLYLDAHGQAIARAATYRILLYVAAVVLAAYLGYLFLRLRANARSLQGRLSLESLIAGISTQFINLPRERLPVGIGEGLGRLAEYAGVDRAYILLGGEAAGDPARAYRWSRWGIDAAHDARESELLALGIGDSLRLHERQGCLHLPLVAALPPGAGKALLQERGVRSWLCIPLRHGGREVGVFGLESVRGDKHWLDDDIALFRTAGEIFVNALERERAESEREALAARLRQAQRLEAIGTLAGGIAHNFNNILGAIFGYSEMALARLPRDGRPRRHVEEVRKAAERAKAIVDQILAFGRRVGHRREAVPMRPLIEEAMDLLRASLPATVTLQAHWRTEDAAVLGDPAQLQQVVMNLCTNAAQAMDGSGTVELVLDAVDIEDQHALTHGNLAAGRYARLSVTDTGHGMDAATMERIFEPFFTTKAPTTGTGLGLASVHGIVADHGGALNVRSQPGAGSTFEVYLAATEMAAAVERGEAPSPGGRGETVLLVDDDRPLMLLGEEMLAALGYEPVGHTSARAALAAFRADPHRFDVVLVDEVMPEMSGSQLAAEVHRIRPQLPIILVTGYGITEDRDALRDAGVRELLRKPLASADLAAALARHLPAGRQTAA